MSKRCAKVKTVNQNVHGSMILPEFRELNALNYDGTRREKTSGRASGRDARTPRTHGAHTGHTHGPHRALCEPW